MFKAEPQQGGFKKERGIHSAMEFSIKIGEAE